MAEGWDWSTGADNLLDMWTAMNREAPGAVDNIIVAAQGRFGSSALQVNDWDTAAAGGGTSVTLDQQLTWIVGFAFKLAGSTAQTYRLLSLYDRGTEQ